MKTFRTLAVVCMAAWSLHAHAQATSPPASAAPPQGAKLEFQSAFAGYRPYQDTTPANWRRINDAARDAAVKGGATGGHMAPPNTPGAAPHRMGGAKP